MEKYHLFPFGRIDRTEKIIVWGAGVVGTQYAEQLIKTDYCQKYVFVDENYINKSDFLVNVYSPNEIRFDDYDKIVLAQMHPAVVAEIRRILDVKRILSEKIIWDDIIINNYSKNYSKNYSSNSSDNSLSRIRELEKRLEQQKRMISNIHKSNCIGQARIKQLLYSIENIMINRIYGDKAFLPSDVEYFVKLHKLLKVSGIKNHKLIRLGNVLGDGGYVMIDDFTDSSNAYSFGINDDVSWDMDMSERCEAVYMYDHTIDSLPSESEKFHFQKKGIADSLDKIDDNLNSLQFFVSSNGHNNCEHMILKMDVEGCEYGALAMASSNLLQQFDQIVLEIHYLLRQENHNKVISTLEHLNKTHFPFHVHINNYNSVKAFRGGFIGNTMEVSFASKSRYQSYDSDNDVNIDVANLNDRFDYNLQNWNELL